MNWHYVVMAKLAVILEDDPRRVAAMRMVFATLAPDVEIVVFDHALDMVSWLPAQFEDIVLMSLDHDVADRGGVDCGTGRQVVDFLATKSPICPVIVHSSNDGCADGMHFALNDVGWPCRRVYPHTDIEWIATSWEAEIFRLIHEGWMDADAAR